ncbi:hypothetical protein UlMin_000515 [Ulmus minor]
MAASSEISRNACHVRSNSLPSRSHPWSVSVEEQLVRLRTSSEATTSSSSSSLCRKLGSLKDLHESIDKLLQLQQTQQSLSKEHNSKSVEQVLDGSLRLIDVCETTRDVFSQMKQCLQELQSSLRRQRGDESGLENEISSYMISKKNFAKMVTKCIKTLKNTRKNNEDKGSELVSVVTILNEVEEITNAVFESLLSFIAQPKASSGWSKLLKLRRVSCEGETNANEVEKMDLQLLALKSGKNEVQKTLKGLETLESNIQELEEELEGLFRRLMKTRVSLLNIFNH